MIKYGSACSGIEAAGLAWEPLGWTPAWFSEIDTAASGVLAYHWPDVPNFGDMLKLDAEQCADIDVLVGGTPCQSFSIAGLRKGLEDDRGNLTLSFVRLAEAIDAVRLRQGKPPLIIVWENVPGVFSDSDNAFGCFLGGMAGEDEPLVPPGERWTNAGYVLGPSRTVAWRVLNAQYFGVPQRRRRVFVVASAREGFDPEKVLFESEGLRGDTQASRKAREEAPGDVVPSLVASGRGVSRAGDSRGQDPVIPCLCASGKAAGSATQQDAENGGILPVTVAMRGREGGATAELGGEVANALRTGDGGGSKSFVLQETATALRARDQAKGVDSDCTDTLIPTVAATIRASDGHHGRSSPRGAGSDSLICTAQNTGQGYWKESATASAPRCGNQGGEARNANLAVFGGNKTSGPRNETPSLLAHGGPTGHGDFESESFVVTAAKTAAPVFASDGQRGHPGPESSDSLVCQTIRAGGHDQSHPSHGGSVGPLGHLRVRRLMPVETERLQGMPDGHTARTADRELADGPRYKLVGNSMAVPVIRWIGQRIHNQLIVKEPR